MPRYEFSEGTSNKFWDINLSGKSFTTTFGKIGSNGQTTIKKFKSGTEAKTAYEKLIAEKVKKGYVAAGGKTAKGKPAKAAPPAATGPDARNKDLEAAVTANPFDKDAWAILADWLQEQGDPRGELMSLQLAGKTKPAQKLLDAHEAYLLGPLAAHKEVYDEGYNNSSSHLRDEKQEKEWQATHKQAFLWKNGFIHRVRLSHDEYSNEFDGECADILEAVLAHPSGRFVVEFAFQSNGDPNDNDLQDLIDVLGKKAPPTTRKITFGDNVDQISWHHTGNLGKLWKGVPNLQTLEIESGEFEVGKMIAPNLEHAIFITGGLSKACGKGIATAQMPKIKHLEIYYGSSNYGGDCTVKDVMPLLDRTDLKHLEYLGLENSEFANALAAAIGGAKVLKGLKTLDLSKGTMTDDGAKALAAAKPALKHLECLDLSSNFLTKDGIALVKGLCKKVITDDQDTPYQRSNGELRYFVNISE